MLSLKLLSLTVIICSHDLQANRKKILNFFYYSLLIYIIFYIFNKISYILLLYIFLNIFLKHYIITHRHYIYYVDVAVTMQSGTTLFLDWILNHGFYLVRFGASGIILCDRTVLTVLLYVLCFRLYVSLTSTIMVHLKPFADLGTFRTTRTCCSK